MERAGTNRVASIGWKTLSPERIWRAKPMKSRIAGIGSLCCVLLAAFPVIAHAQNIVQNGNFKSLFADWSGLGAIINNPNAPNGVFGSGGDIYQDLFTSPGQQYSLTFSVAADLYFGPSLNLELSLNNQELTSFSTPPYTYNNQINRSDQMRWEQHSYSFTASSNITRLEFIDLNTYDFGLAAVSVVPVPEPKFISMACVILGLGFMRRMRSSTISTR